MTTSPLSADCGRASYQRYAEIGLRITLRNGGRSGESFAPHAKGLDWQTISTAPIASKDIFALLANRASQAQRSQGRALPYSRKQAHSAGNKSAQQDDESARKKQSRTQIKYKRRRLYQFLACSRAPSTQHAWNKFRQIPANSCRVLTQGDSQLLLTALKNL